MPRAARRRGCREGLALITDLDAVILTTGLLVPGWCSLSLLGLKSLSPALAVPAALAMGLSIASVAAWVAWLSGTGMTGATVLVVVIAAGVVVARVVWRERIVPIDKPGRFDVGVAALGVLCIGLSLTTGTFLGESADSFYHLSAARNLLRANEALPQDIFFGVAVQYPDASSGSLHLVLAWLSLIGGMVPAWAALSAFGAALTALSFAAFAREVTRSTPAALTATFLYILLALNLDMRDAGYPSRIGLDIAWLSLAFLLRFARADSFRWRELVPVCLLGFSASAVYSGTAPFLIVMVLATLGAASVVALWDRHLRLIRPLAIASVAVVLVELPMLVLRALATVPAPGAEASLATVAPPLKVLVLHGYAFLDFRLFWFNGLLTITTLGTLCLLGRARRLLLGGDPGAAMVWGGLLFVPAVSSTPALASWPTGIYLFARIALLLGQLSFVTLGWELALLPGLFATIRERAVAPRGTSRLVAGLLLACAAVYLIAGQLPAGALERYIGSSSRAISAGANDDLTRNWADRLRALDSAGPGTILANPDASYALAGLTGHDVVAVPMGHGPSQDEARDGALRRGDVADALNAAADPSVLLSVLIRYHVTFVIIDQVRDGEATWEKFAGERALSTVAEGAGWRLYRFELGQLDEALNLPLTGGVGLFPSRVMAGRAVFVRFTSSGQRKLAQVAAKGLQSGATYQTQVMLPDQAGGTITAPLLLPDSAPVDRYVVTVRAPDDPPVVAGQIEVGRAYEAEFFAGVIINLKRGFVRVPGWETINGADFGRGEAAFALTAGIVASHPLLDPPGDYCVSIVVSNQGESGTDTLDVGVGGAVVTETWPGQPMDVRVLEVAMRSGSDHRLTYWVPAGDPVSVVVDSITIFPLASSGACTSPAS